MAGLRIVADDLSGEAIGRLIAFHLNDMRRWSPPESVHAMPRERLARPDISFFSAWRGDALAGCGALKQLEPDHGELKSMRVDPAFLRQGVGQAILLHLIEEARRRGYSRLSLETGKPIEFQAARALYAKHGFSPCPPFGAYLDDGFSLCMTRTL
ncbi:GNAT family N-acetyltransferase [Novosphingobium sp. Gsoil 351]|uniref:GNAT family N-acetyltransferase n=1 Tax=Novosphingobium sp. Gsoil 351 TaxID=2675225 RepID=UPI0012B4B79E|nr:GNAT family N-acetyltransferase [Novosphingobium sp. Gsoil 351]